MKSMEIKRSIVFVALALVLSLSPFLLAAQQQQFFDLGDLRLDSGQVIRGCTLGYRTFGRLNDERSNAVLFPTWLGGTSSELEPLIGPGKLVDSSKYFVIAVDAFGNGVSSSPSNSRQQPGPMFPEFSIGDMIRAQHLLITGKLGISSLHAVVGISMGGMQTFHWMVAYPGLMKKAVPIVGTPKPTSYDLLLWQTEMEAIQNKNAPRGWDKRSLDTVACIHIMASYTPDHFVLKNSAEDLTPYLEAFRKDIGGHDPNDWAWQLKAISRYDIYAAFGTPAETAKRVRAKVLVVLSSRDHMVNPKPAREMADLMKAGSLTLDSSCGHLIFQCEFNKITSTVSDFLDR